MTHYDDDESESAMTLCCNIIKKQYQPKVQQ